IKQSRLCRTLRTSSHWTHGRTTRSTLFIEPSGAGDRRLAALVLQLLLLSSPHPFEATPFGSFFGLMYTYIMKVAIIDAFTSAGFRAYAQEYHQLRSALRSRDDIEHQCSSGVYIGRARRAR